MKIVGNNIYSYLKDDIILHAEIKDYYDNTYDFQPDDKLIFQIYDDEFQNEPLLQVEVTSPEIHITNDKLSSLEMKTYYYTILLITYDNIISTIKSGYLYLKGGSNIATQ